MTRIALRLLHHQNKDWIGIYFKNLASINSIIKKQTGARWSTTHKCWYIPLKKQAYKNLVAALEGNAMCDDAELKFSLQKQKTQQPEIRAAYKITRPTRAEETLPSGLNAANKEALRSYIEQLKLKAYSIATIKTYKNEFLQLLQILKQKEVNDLTVDDLKRYMVFAMEKKGISENTAHSRLNALKFYFEQVLGREKFFWKIPRPKKQLQLPRFFNQEEITAIIKSAGNIKHKTMLMLAYSSGLRVSEVVNIKTKEIDSKRMCILIKQAKGKKDRIVTLSPVLLIMLREYWKTHKPSKEGYLFQGQYKDEPYSSRSLQLVLAAAKEKAGVIKPGSIHALRHSFATHLLDKGTDVTMIMKLLGHNDIKTTLRYLHVTNRDMLQIISPLDDLKLD